MIVDIYDAENQAFRHRETVRNVTHTLTRRAHDSDAFSAEGICDEPILNRFGFVVLSDDAGIPVYSCLLGNEEQDENGKRKIKGIDLRDLAKTDILLDFTNGLPQIEQNLYLMLKTAIEPAITSATIGVAVSFTYANELSGIDTSILSEGLDGTYKITDASDFVKPYLKYFGVLMTGAVDLPNNRIVFSFAKGSGGAEIAVEDFDAEVTTTSPTVNRTVATIKTETIPRPTVAQKYYYLTTENQIVEGSATQPGTGTKIVPVKTKIYEGDTLAGAQREAITELADQRYVDNIIVTHRNGYDPIELHNLPLLATVTVWKDGAPWRVLPVSEQSVTENGSGTIRKTKLGFKKILLTEIIKGGK